MPTSTTVTISCSLRQRIKSGQWKDGFQISESSVAREFKVCRSTVGKSLKSLESEGLILSRKGKGRFVQDPSKCRTRQIGVVLLDMRHLEFPVTARAVAGIQSVLFDSGDHLRLCALNERVYKHSANLADRSSAVLKAIDPSDLDVIILLAHEATVTLVERLLESCPVVWLHNNTVRPGLVGVKADIIAASYAATRQLLGLGHRQIILAGSLPLSSPASREMWDGYRLAMEDGGQEMLLPVEEEGFKQSEQTEKLLIERFEQILDRPDRPTAILCGDDELAMMIHRAATDKGLCIPNDLSIMSLHDATVRRPAPMEWSGLNINFWQMGQIAAEQAIYLREHPRHHGVVTVPVGLAEGQSVSPIGQPNFDGEGSRLISVS